MFNSGVLDVAVGLIFLYLLLSLIASAVNEIIENKLRMRAGDLERGIRELLGGEKEKEFTKKFYDHPLIYSLFLKSYDAAKVDSQSGRYKTPADLPSYIPRRNFALALMDIVLPAGDTAGQESGAAGATPPAKSGSTPPWPGTGTPAVAPAPVKPLRDAVAALPNSNLRRALLPLIDAAAGDVAVARRNIEDWFDSAMDRVSGWYKRRTQIFILIIGLVLTALTNADTVTIANSLSRDVSMRNALVAAAAEYSKGGGTTQVPGDAAADIDACKRDAGTPECRVAWNLEEIGKLGLPVGWRRDDKRSFPETFGGWLMKILGLLLTTFAISLGAPFWFDVLNKIIVVRSTVKPKEKSPDEPSVDRP